MIELLINTQGVVNLDNWKILKRLITYYFLIDSSLLELLRAPIFFTSSRISKTSLEDMS